MKHSNLVNLSIFLVVISCSSSSNESTNEVDSTKFMTEVISTTIKEPPINGRLLVGTWAEIKDTTHLLIITDNFFSEIWPEEEPHELTYDLYEECYSTFDFPGLMATGDDLSEENSKSPTPDITQRNLIIDLRRCIHIDSLSRGSLILNEGTPIEYKRIKGRTETLIASGEFGPNLFENDNLTIEESFARLNDFWEKKDIEGYSHFSNYKYELDINAPSIDNNRGATQIAHIKRYYFEGSENVAVQQNTETNEIIWFHPNGKIYHLGGSYRKDYFVDLNNTVMMEGEVKYRNGIGYPVGFWNTPTFSNFNMDDKKWTAGYPGTVEEVFNLINWYNNAPNERR